MAPPAARRRVAVLAVWTVASLACAWIIRATPVDTDLSAFLPRTPSPEEGVLVAQIKEGVVSRLVLVGIAGADTDTLAAINHALAETLAHDARVTSVANGGPERAAVDRAILWNHRYLLAANLDAATFSEEGLRAALDRDAALLASSAGVLVKETLAADPTGALVWLLTHLEGQTRPPRLENGVWFDAAGRRTLLIVQSRAPGFDIDAQADLLKAIDAAFQVAKARPGGQDARLTASGPGVFSVRTRALIQGDAWRFSSAATALIALLLLSVYRSVRVLVLGLMPVASGALAGIAVVGLVYPSVHGTTLGFGVTLIGEAVDYAIYLFSQTSGERAVRPTLAAIWPTLRLGMLTSVCGFSALLLSSFSGLGQLGLFSIAGLLAAAAVTRYVLPELLPAGFAGVSAPGLSNGVLALARAAFRLRAWFPVPLAAALLLLAALPLQGHALWDDQLVSLSPIPHADQEVDAALRHDLNAPDVRFLVRISATSQEEALQRCEAVTARLTELVDAKRLEGFQAPCQVLPSQAAQQARQALLPDAATLRTRLAAALVGSPFRGDAFEPFVAAVAAARAGPLMQRTDLEGSDLALEVDSLLAGQEPDFHVTIPLRGLAEPAAVRHALDASAVPGAVFLDLKAESDGLYRTYLRDALWLSGAGVLAIIVLLALALRDLPRLGRVLAPLAAAVVVTTALVAALDGRLTLFHLIGLTLVVAAGSNYCLFFEQKDLTRAERDRTIASLGLACASATIGFGVLAFSRIAVLHDIGLTVACGAALSLVGAMMTSGRPPDEARPGSTLAAPTEPAERAP